MSGFSTTAGLGLTGAMIVALAAAAAVAPPAARASGAPPTATAPVQAAAVTESGDCSRSRRRLWIENVGWVVRKVTVCR